MNEDNGKGYGCFVMFVSGVAFVFSVWALLMCDNRCRCISGEGALVTGLSTIVTIVIGWQIWQVIDLKNTKKGIMAETRKMSIEAQRDVHIDMAMHSSNLGMRYEEVYHLLWQIICESRLGNYPQCDLLIRRLSGVADSSVAESRKSALKSIAALIENKDKIGRYKEIDGIIDKLFT